MLHVLPLVCGGRVNGPEPTITSVGNTEDRAIACGVSWRRDVAWVLDIYNDVGFEIDIYSDTLAIVVATGLLTSAGHYVHDTTDVGDPAFVSVLHEAQYTVRVVRKSDSVVVDSMQTTNAQVLTGPPC